MTLLSGGRVVICQANLTPRKDGASPARVTAGRLAFTTSYAEALQGSELDGAYDYADQAIKEATDAGIVVVSVDQAVTAPTARAVSEFLEEFLSDRRVVDLNPIVWGFLRRAIILPRRSGRVAEAYASQGIFP